MQKKILRGSLTPNHSLVLPPEAADILGSEAEFYIVIDKEKNKIILSKNDPEIEANNEILNQLAELNQGLSLEEYTEPVPESFLKRRGKGEMKEEK